ncbi:MAG TPA: DUF4398 domain-containing protein [Polyangiaceae bacterium]|jgi:hypothetical protein|nr:DUF4398 domain-containing protein [Polyangiaceae bacterium]
MTALTKVLGSVTLALAACTSTHPMPANYVPAQAAIGAADAVGAGNEPRAALHLKMARDAVARAQVLARQGDDHEAALTLERARTDAELALMVTREANARREANDAKREVERLRRSN